MRIYSRLFCQTLILFSLGIVLIGCGQGSSDPKADIKKAIEDHLAKRSDLAIGSMVMEMKEVRVEGDQAQADVTFRTTTNPPAQMDFTYNLRQADGKWAIENSQPSSSDSTHSSPENPSSPEDASPAAPNAETEALPEGHPPM